MSALDAIPESSLIRSGTLANRPRYVDTRNPALAVECPRCGLRTARFLQYCSNCGYALWPSPAVVSAAFTAWKAADKAVRGEARPYDLELPAQTEPQLYDYDARAHELGIHVSPNSNYPFVICLGLAIAAFGAIPFSAPVRIGFLVVGALVFLFGIFGWVVLEDTRYFPADGVEHPGGEAH